MQTKLSKFLVAKPLKKVFLWTALFFLFFLSAPRSLLATFSDLTSDPLYKTYIESFEQANIIVGDTAGGKPTGYLRPNDFIQRDEFSKVAVLVRLLEEKQKEGKLADYQNLNLDAFTLKMTELLKPYYKVINGAKAFTDIQQKEDSCASDPAGCQPWHTEYINYASSKGMIKGYADNTFKPANPILRIHALKLIMAENGNILAPQDAKFQKLSSDPRIQKVHKPKCLAGSEALILANNGGANSDSQNLLAYAILADKLDLFGNSCQVFTQNTTAKQRADFLQQPITRKEIARYYALTTDLSSLASDPNTDPTTSTEEENGMNFYVEKYEGEGELAEEQEEKLEENSDPKAEQINKNKKAEEGIKPDNTKNEMLKDSSNIEYYDFAGKKGRCCETNSISSCTTIDLNKITNLSPNSASYDSLGKVWVPVIYNGKTCQMPYQDILEGYRGGSLSIQKTTPSLSPNKKIPYAIPKKILPNIIPTVPKNPLNPSQPLPDLEKELVSEVSPGVKLSRGVKIIQALYFICPTLQSKDCMQVKKTDLIKTNGDLLSGRLSSDGITNLWQPLNYNGKKYYALVRDIKYETKDNAVLDYVEGKLVKNKAEINNMSAIELMSKGIIQMKTIGAIFICETNLAGAACKSISNGSHITITSPSILGRYSQNGMANLWVKIKYDSKEKWMMLKDLPPTGNAKVDKYVKDSVATQEEEALLRDWDRPFGFWSGEVWSPYDNWMTVSYDTGSQEREAGLIEFIKANKQMFIDAANAPRVKGKVSPPLIAAIMWDEMVGSGLDESTGYQQQDLNDDTNLSTWEGQSYGPFQTGIRTAVDVIEKGYAPKPKNYDTFFGDEKGAYQDGDGKIQNFAGKYLTQMGKEKLEGNLVKFPFQINVAAGRLAQIVDRWNEPGGADLRYVDRILGNLYSWNLVGTGVKNNPGPSPRSNRITEKSKEFNDLIFGGTYMQREASPILK